MPLAPDLLNGFMVNGVGSPNQWATEIQCVLETDGKPDETVYLSHECRSENVPFSNPEGGRDLFQASQPWEFLVYRTGGKTLQLTTADVFSTGSMPATAAAGTSTIVPPTTDLTSGCVSEVECPSRPVRFLSGDEALMELRARRLQIRKTFMKLKWMQLGQGYTLYCPCRYINYPEPGAEWSYVQPISGYVLFPIAGGVHMLAYVACAENADGETLMEFCCKRYRSVVGWINENHQLPESVQGFLETLDRELPVIASFLDGITRVENPSFQLFVYE